MNKWIARKFVKNTYSRILCRVLVENSWLKKGGELELKLKSRGITRDVCIKKIDDNRFEVIVGKKA